MNLSTFCPLPWNHLATHPQGGVSLCCRVDYHDGRGMSFDKINENEREFKNLNTSQLDQTMNSDSFKLARLQMLKGEKPLACMGCYKDEELGLESKRNRENKQFNTKLNELKKMTQANGAIPVNIEYAELRLGNLCNLKCRTCNPYSSSKWVSEYKQMQNELSFVRNYDLSADFSWAESEKFWMDFLANSKNLKQLYINGGEPTLIKQHWVFLENLIAKGLSDKIDIKYNINTTVLPEQAFTIWKNFKSVFIGASVDDLRDRNAYIRHGAKWEDIEINLRKIRDFGFGIAIEQTVSPYNVFYLDEMEQYCREQNIGFGLNFVYDPEYLSLKSIPPNVREKTLDKLSKHMSPKWLKEVEAHFREEFQEKDWDQFKKYTAFLDRKRGESFVRTFSEFAIVCREAGFSVE